MTMFEFDGDTFRLEMGAPGGEVFGRDAEGDVAGASAAVRDKEAGLDGDVRTEEKEDGGADLEGDTAVGFEGVHEAEAENVAIEGGGALQVGDVERGFEDGGDGWHGQCGGGAEGIVTRNEEEKRRLV